MKVMIFNVQNDMKKASSDKINAILEIIKNENPDVVGFQELTYDLKKNLEKELKEYHFYGRSRYGFNTFFDEYNSLMVKRKLEVIEMSTYSLGKNPHKIRSKKLGSFFPRICTTIVCVYNNKRVKIVNTHLDKGDRNKEYQLAVLSEILKNNNYPLIVMGDFNMCSLDKVLTSFTNKINLLDICEHLGKTCVETEEDKPIDHIFLDYNLEYKNLKKVDNLNVSNHFPIVCDIELK